MSALRAKAMALLDAMPDHTMPDVITFFETYSDDEPNEETIAAMLEAERLVADPAVKRYSDVEEALAELKRR